MTNIELEAARSTIRANRAIVDEIESPNWEKRRYEIAKTMLPYCAKGILELLTKGASLKDAGYGSEKLTDCAAESAMDYADALIKKLKEKTNKTE